MGSKRFDDGHPPEEEHDGFDPEEGENEGSDFIVLGQELARANAEEELRLAKGNVEKSPIPDQKYDRWRGETSLIRPVPLPLDSAIAEVCKRFADGGRIRRANAYGPQSVWTEFYTLITFADRAAVFAIQGMDLDGSSAG